MKSTSPEVGEWVQATNEEVGTLVGAYTEDGFTVGLDIVMFSPPNTFHSIHYEISRISDWTFTKL